MKNGNTDEEKIINHWITTSDRDFKTMMHLYDGKDYHWCLFIGHLVIERLLKACIVKLTRSSPPFTHDLRRLAKISEIELKEEHKLWLDTITTFNLNARYESYKQEFYKKCTQEYTEQWLERIKSLRQWIKTRL